MPATPFTKAALDAAKQALDKAKNDLTHVDYEESTLGVDLDNLDRQINFYKSQKEQKTREFAALRGKSSRISHAYDIALDAYRQAKKAYEAS